MNKALFIAGTGTEVGKTVVSSLLLGFLRQAGVRAGYQKWASTGGEMPEDLLYCLKNNELSLDAKTLDQQVVYRFRMAASPHLAAEQEGRAVEPERIRIAFRQTLAEHELLLVEGVGGMLVPLRRDLLLADFLAEFHLPTLIVARSGLGTINHTLLTIEALRSRGIPVLGVVFSDEEAGMSEDDLLVNDNLRTIADIGQVEVFGRLPRFAEYARLQTEFAPIGELIRQRIFAAQEG